MFHKRNVFITKSFFSKIVIVSRLSAYIAKSPTDSRIRDSFHCR